MKESARLKCILFDRAHLAEDIHPYTCIAGDCPVLSVLYITRAYWERHFFEDHGANCWGCPICDDVNTIFPHAEDLIRHVQDHHTDVMPPDTIETIFEWGAVKSIGLTTCPLCDSFGSLNNPELIDHVLKHVHGFPLRSLPWPKDKEAPRPSLNIARVNEIKSWLNNLSFADGNAPEPGSVRPQVSSFDGFLEEPDETVAALTTFKPMNVSLYPPIRLPTRMGRPVGSIRTTLTGVKIPIL